MVKFYLSHLKEKEMYRAAGRTYFWLTQQTLEVQILPVSSHHLRLHSNQRAHLNKKTLFIYLYLYTASWAQNPAVRMCLP